MCDQSRTIVQSKIHPIRHQIATHAKMGITMTERESLYGAVDTDSIDSVIDASFTVAQSLRACWVNGHRFATVAKNYKTFPSLESDLQDLLERASE